LKTGLLTGLLFFVIFALIMKKSLIPAVLALVISACSTQPKENYTVVVSLDAFRWDYPEMFDTPWLDSIAKVGVKATMLPSFPSSTFPNHYTIATGLVPDHHGIVNSNFWDSENEVMYGMGDSATRNNVNYYGGEPIWTTAEKQGVKTASLYWVGSDIPIKGMHPSIFHFWADEPRFTYEERAHETVRLLSLPENERPRLIMTYFDDPDWTTHGYGATSPEGGAMVHFLDSLMGIIYQGAMALPYADKINIIITADHGMTDICPERWIDIDDYVKPEWCNHIVSTNPTTFFCKEGCRDSVINALSNVEHLFVWKSEEVPAELMYGTSPHLGDVIVSAELGWQFSHDVRDARGQHGYLPSYPDMQVVFRACGPDFKKGYAKENKFINVDIYPTLAHILGIVPEKTDGDISRTKDMLTR